MDNNARAKEAQLRAISAYTRRPDRALATLHGIAKLDHGLGCVYEQDGHRISIDMPVAIGGGDQAPSPGYFGRAAICGCLAIGIKMTAAREDLRIDWIQVGIEQEWDNRGLLAMDGANPVPLATRISIGIASPEQKEKVENMVSRALATDPWFLVFRDAQLVSTAVSINGPLA